MIVVHHPAMKEWLRASYSRDALEALASFLADQGTLDFAALPSGVYPASYVGLAGKLSGYQNAWVRDNVYVAFAHDVAGITALAAKPMNALAAFLETQRKKMDAVSSGLADPHDVRFRPHVRFDGRTTRELPDAWSNAQNDALGYFLWMYCRLAIRRELQPKAELLASLARFLFAIAYWEDEDSGHWEERRKIQASSIGAILAGLIELQRLKGTDAITASALENRGVVDNFLQDLMDRGRSALGTILPAECIQGSPGKARRYDAALLFLVYPLQVVTAPMSDRILSDVETKLQGPHGIRRYIGDSYWTADYKKKVPPEQRTANVSEHQDRRDALAKIGEEAQWCIFDPIISAIGGLRFAQTGEARHRERQIYHFQRALGQLTSARDRPTGPRCAEAFYLEEGEYVPNDHVPLLWTQANLWLALSAMKASVEESLSASTPN
jgi:hypothetical protein